MTKTTGSFADNFEEACLRTIARHSLRRALRHLLEIWGIFLLQQLLVGLLLLWAVNALFGQRIPLNIENLLAMSLCGRILTYRGRILGADSPSRTQK